MTPNNCDIDHLLKLSVDTEKLKATLRIEPNESDNSITRESLCAYLEGCDISAPCILPDELDQLILSSASNPNQPNERVVAKGKPPITGDNAVFEFSVRLQERVDDISKRKEAYLKAEENNTLGEEDPDDQESIDFYNASPFLIVSKDEVIGRVVEASPGEDGTNVHGKIIPTKAGKDLPDLIDQTLMMDSAGTVHALIDGHLTYDSMRLRINQVLEIQGCVDFSTGNIDFPCDVLVEEGVRDRFIVKAGSNIEIRKLVEASTLDSAQDIILHNGMAGRETGTIRTGKDLKAGYLEGVLGTIGGQCQVAKEITNCHLSIAGSIDCPGAAVRGGEIYVTKGGVVGSIGSVQGVKTDIVIGWIPEIQQKIQMALELKPKILSSIEKQTQELETFKENLGKPTPEQATEILFIESEIGNFREKLDELDAAIDRLREIVLQQTVRKLDVKAMIYAKTTIWLPGYQIRFEDDVKGELAIDMSKCRKPIIIRNGKTEHLRTVADIIEDDRVMPLSPPKGDGSFSDDSDDELLEAA